MKKLMIIGYVWPEPSTTAAGHRMLQLIHTFKSFGYEITFGSTAVQTEFSADLEALGVHCVSFKLNHHSFDDFVQQLNPSVVVFDRFMVEEQFGWRVAESVPDAVRILNTEDLHSLRRTREECHKENIDFSIEQWLEKDITKREIASIYRSDLTLLVSTFEMGLLTEELNIPNKLLLHLPFMLESVEEQPNWPSFEERQDFITYGNGKHAPNVDSIKYLKEAIWPLIRKKLPKVELKIYGAYLPQHIQEMHNPKEGIHIMGWAEDLDVEIQKARICLAPLRFGAGIKGKLVDAMQNGTPTITTSIGAEGMHGNLPWNGAIADEHISFVEHAVSLYQYKGGWEQAQSNGIQMLVKCYSKANLEEKLTRAIETVALDVQAHRNQNFIGQILQHQKFASTKYMSKWIEEKNREK